MPESGYPSGPPVDPAPDNAPVPPGPQAPPTAMPQEPPRPYGGAVPPANPQGYGPPVAPPSPYGYQQAPPARSRTGLWWTLGILLVVLLIVGTCALPFVFLFSGSDISASATGDSVAVIHVDGVIAGTGDYYSGVITPEYFYNLLEQAEEDGSVKAVVLRVDSPGGTVAASEEIAAYVKAAKKPVVVSVGDINASGAYMISSQADEIWAMPGSSVGSIGVIAEIPNVEGLLDKIGVDFQVITAGKYKDAGSPYRELTDEERALIRGEVEEAYDQFIDIVAEGRDLKRADVEKLATGWTWGGEKAMQYGLIDKIGTHQDALDAAARRGGIKGDYEIVTYEDDINEVFQSIFGIEQSLEDLKALSSRDALVRQSVPR